MVGIDRRKNHKRVRFAVGSGNGASERNAHNTGEGNSSYPHSQHIEQNSYEDDDDDGLAADISSGRRRNQHINMDGYGSNDSDQDEIVNMSDYSDDAEDRGLKDSGDNPDKQQASEDNDDMFADEQINSPLANSKDYSDNKRKRYLDLDDIEGQEMSSISRVDRAEDSLALRSERNSKGKQPAYKYRGDGLADKDSDEDSEGEGKARTRIEAFNMRDDLEQGQFDANGNFVWNKKDPNAYQDSWLDGMSKKAIKMARDSKVRKDQDQTVQENSILRRWDAVSNDDIIVAIINRLCSRETILSALARIGGPKKKTKNKWNRKAKAKIAGATNSNPNNSEESEKERQRKKGIEELTELADQAMARGLVDIYDQTYEQLVRQMRLTNRVPEDWVPGTILPTSAFAETEKIVEDQVSNAPSLEAEVDGGLLDDLDELGET
ncbi:hypothetical protein GGI23_001785 [Coemansia sp. RSA 2559]|nr:hypothetical protein GGI23_001785 [Coemansia sp. RSA 2559]